VIGSCTRSWYGSFFSFSYVPSPVFLFFFRLFFIFYTGLAGVPQRSITGFRICATKSQRIPETSTSQRWGKEPYEAGGAPTLGGAMAFFHSNLVGSLVPWKALSGDLRGGGSSSVVSQVTGSFFHRTLSRRKI